MITTLLALTAVATAPTAAQAPTAASIIGRMFQRYADAKTLSGTIRFTQAANGMTLVIETDIQHEKPSKLYLRQTRKEGPDARAWLVTSDGVRFTYDKPEGTRFTIPGKTVRLMEAVAPEGEPPLLVSSIYGAAGGSIADKSPILNVVLGGNEHLRFVLGQWAGLKYQGKTQVRGIVAHLIKGQWRQNPAVAPTGEFEMYISEQGEFLRYGQRETVAPPPQVKVPPISIVSVWEADLKVDGPVNQALFKVAL